MKDDEFQHLMIQDEELQEDEDSSREEKKDDKTKNMYNHNKAVHHFLRCKYRCKSSFRRKFNHCNSIAILMIILFMTFLIPKRFAIVKRYNRNSYYIHYKKKYDRCTFKPDGPTPAILMALGRSGSSVTWDTLSNIAGGGDNAITVAHEVTGGNAKNSIAFFDDIKDHIADRWASLKLCNIQRYHVDKMRHMRSNAGKGTSTEEEKHYAVVGFQWKPYRATFDQHYAVDGLKRVADEGLKVIYLTRNPLDRYISNLRHKGYIHSDEVPAHCKVGDDDCVKRHKAHSKGIVIRVGNDEGKERFLHALESGMELDNLVENRLESFGVNYVHVEYEKLYDGSLKDEDYAEEWMRLFRFLGVGPEEGLTMGEVRGSFQLAATSTKVHSEIIENFKEVKQVLKGTKFETLLH